MELLVVIAFIWFISTRNSGENDVLKKDSSDLDSLFERKKYKPKNVNYSNRDKEDAPFKKEIIFFTYDETRFIHDSWKISGKSVTINSEDGDNFFVFIEAGKHRLKDKNYIIEYNVERHYDSKGQKKMYFNHISVNGIPVEGKMTNIKSATYIIKDISNITKGAIFIEHAIGERFFIECAATILFNEINLNRTLADYIDMPAKIREKFLQNADEKLFSYIDSLENSFYKESDYNTPNVNNFDIYLKVMEFQSVNGITYDDIKIQYKKLAKKYHPDSNNGDENRFKLIVDAYEYLQDYYPR